MWIDTPNGAAFVPEPLSAAAIADVPDSIFPEFFEELRLLTKLLDENCNAKILYQMLLRREAQTFAASLKPNRPQDSVQVHYPFVPFHVFDSPEALNYARAAQFAWQSKRKPYTGAYLRAVHKRLLPTGAAPGAFRHDAVGLASRWFGQKDIEILLTPSDLVGTCLSALEAFAVVALPSHRLAQAAAVHLQTVAIHPFQNGNGRVARASLPALLRNYGLVNEPVLFASELLLLHSQEYYNRAVAFERHGELSAWVRFFVNLLTRQATLSASFLRTVCYIRRELCHLLMELGIEETVAARFTDERLLSPSFRLSEASVGLRLSERGATLCIARLIGKYGLNKIVNSPDPIFQFGDLYDVLCL